MAKQQIKKYRFSGKSRKYTLAEILKKATTQKRGDSSGISIIKDGELERQDFQTTKKHPYIFIWTQDCEDSTMWSQEQKEQVMKKRGEVKEKLKKRLRRRKKLSKLPIGKWSDDDLKDLIDFMATNLLQDGRYDDWEGAYSFVWSALHDSLDYDNPIGGFGILMGTSIEYGWIYDWTNKYLETFKLFWHPKSDLYKRVMSLQGTNIPLEKARKVLKKLMDRAVSQTKTANQKPSPYRHLKKYRKTYLTAQEIKRLKKAISNLKGSIRDYPGVTQQDIKGTNGKRAKMSNHARINLQMEILDAVLEGLPVPPEPHDENRADDWRNDYQIHIQNQIVGPSIEGGLYGFKPNTLQLMLDYIAKRRSHYKIPFKKMNKTTWAWPENRAGKKGEKTYFITKIDFAGGPFHHPVIGTVRSLYEVRVREGIDRHTDFLSDFKYLRDAKEYILQRALEDNAEKRRKK